jgi:hypothetical protein
LNISARISSPGNNKSEFDRHRYKNGESQPKPKKEQQMTSNVKPQNTIFDLQMASHAARRSHDFVSYLHYMESWFQLMAELEILTGKITPPEMSEISVAGTRWGYLLFRNGKTKSRQRGIRITPAIRRVLDVLDKRAGGYRRLKKINGGKVRVNTVIDGGSYLLSKGSLLPLT